MARINLLPWRIERRERRRKEFLATLVLSALAAVLLGGLIVNYYSRQIDGQTERTRFLQQKIDQVRKQLSRIKSLEEHKAQLLERKDIIEKLQSDRSQMVHLFDALVRTIPDGVVLISIKQEGGKLMLEGRSQSNARVSAYLRSLEGSGWMTRPELSIIEAKQGDPGLPFSFSLSVLLANPNAPRDADAERQTDGRSIPRRGAEDTPVDTTQAATTSGDGA